MKNIELWKPSKYIFKNDKLIGSRDSKEVSISSRLLADITAAFYNENLKKYIHGKVLDLGCGKVPLYEAYKNYISENVCVDWGNTYNKNPFLDYELDINQKLPFADNEFNSIILSDVLEHIRKPELLLGEMYRILSVNGKALINVPFMYGLHEQPYDYFRYTKHALKSMAEDAGFKIILLEPSGGTPEIFADMLSKHFSIVPLIGNPFAIVVQKLTWWFIQTQLGKRISTKTADFFPIGYKMILEKV